MSPSQTNDAGTLTTVQLLGLLDDTYSLKREMFVFSVAVKESATGERTKMSLADGNNFLALARRHLSAEVFEDVKFDLSSVESP